MKFHAVVRPAAATLAALLSSGLAFAQAEPPKTAPLQGPAVLSDLAPPPAEERESAGAIVLDDSRVRAQRRLARERRDPTTVMGNISAPAEKALRETLPPAKPVKPSAK
jgi:hypothetical protein